jgi:hypothetical protein
LCRFALILPSRHTFGERVTRAPRSLKTRNPTIKLQDHIACRVNGNLLEHLEDVLEVIKEILSNVKL